MSIPTYNFPSHIKGDTFSSRQITFSSVTNNTPIDLTGAEINMQFKENASSTIAYEWTTLDGSIELTDAVNGVITMVTKVIDVPASTYVYDIQVKDNTNFIKTYFTGSQKIIQDITTL